MTSQDEKQPDHFGYVAAFLGPALWGLFPIFYVLLADYPAIEIVAHRSLWAFILVFALYAFTGKLSHIAYLMRPSKQLAYMIFAALMIAVNWTVFVYAVGEVRVIEASFGYFIYPLFAVGASMLFLGEKLDMRGKIALALSIAGVCIKGWSLGFIPDISLILAISFSLYAVVRKQITIDALDGFFIETILIVPFAIAFLLVHMTYGGHLFFDGEIRGFILAVCCGLVTTIPLFLFLRGNKAMPLSLTAFIFYINPTLQLLCGIWFFGEMFSTKDLMAFGCIWTGLIVQFARRPKAIKL